MSACAAQLTCVCGGKLALTAEELDLLRMQKFFNLRCPECGGTAAFKQLDLLVMKPVEFIQLQLDASILEGKS